jgi:ribosomal protein S14
MVFTNLMTIKSANLFDNFLRHLFKNNEHLVCSINSLYDCNFPLQFYSTHLIKQPWLTKVHNKCIISSNSKVLRTRVRLSRHITRKYSLFGSIPGITKAVW